MDACVYTVLIKFVFSALSLKRMMAPPSETFICSGNIWQETVVRQCGRTTI